jgi:hypothetical protein
MEASNRTENLIFSTNSTSEGDNGEWKEREEVRGRGVQARVEEELVEDVQKKLRLDAEPTVEEEGITFSTSSQSPSQTEPLEETKSTPSNIPSATPTTTKSKGPKSKYFEFIDPMEMTMKMSELQEEDPEEFKAIMMLGNELIKCGEENDVPGFHKRMLEAKNTNLLFWHTSKAFKKAIDNFHKEMIEYILTTLKIDLSHEVFQYILHYLISR